ncbi:MAG: magnesium transporter [Pseudomonadales bacterium]|nr:magnesium transporter [Pseudomonadales bacterium]
MKRHYYVTKNLDELESTKTELEQAGISPAHIRVLTEDTVGTQAHHLRTVSDLMKSDAVHTAVIGALLGLLLAACVLALAHLSGLALAASWTPFILLSAAILGFCTWEGGLLGIQRPNHLLRRFMGTIKKGRHVMLVDVDAQQEPMLARIVALHPALRAAHDDLPSAHGVLQWK